MDDNSVSCILSFVALREYHIRTRLRFFWGVMCKAFLFFNEAFFAKNTDETFNLNLFFIVTCAVARSSRFCCRNVVKCTLL